MTRDAYSISDLARLTGVNVRTIRYYLAQGLLPASGESGPGAHYGEGHLDRLRLTRRLQQQHLPLAEIRRRLAELTDADVASVIATSIEPEQAPTTSALDYVRAVLGKQVDVMSSQVAVALAAAPAPARASAPAPAASPAAALAPVHVPAPLLRSAGYASIGMVSESTETHGAAVADPPALGAPLADAANFINPAATETHPAPATVEPASQPPTPERSQWERLSLGPNIELHIRRPLGRLEQRRVERLLTIARQVLKEEQP